MVQTQFCDVTLEQHLKRMHAAGLVEVHGTTWGGGGGEQDVYYKFICAVTDRNVHALHLQLVSFDVSACPSWFPFNKTTLSFNFSSLLTKL